MVNSPSALGTIQIFSVISLSPNLVDGSHLHFDLQQVNILLVIYDNPNLKTILRYRYMYLDKPVKDC